VTIPADMLIPSRRPAPPTDAAPARMSQGLAHDQRSFLDILGKAAGAPASRAAGRGDTQPREDRAREAAEQLVAQTFVLPMLKEMRQSNSAAPPFAPSQGEKQFRALMDAELAQRIVKASRFNLVQRLARDLLNVPGAAVEPPTGLPNQPTERGRSER
jgi:Rod binding domain-containing protein